MQMRRPPLALIAGARHQVLAAPANVPFQSRRVTKRLQCGLMKSGLLATLALATLVGLAACGGTDTGTPGGTGAPSGSGSTGPKKNLPANPVQLTVDPCTLVTQSEASAALGVQATGSKGSTGFSCNYTNASAHLSAIDQTPEECGLTVLQIQNITPGKSQKPVDIGDGGIQYLGAGKVQFVKSGGCISIEGARGTLGSGLIIPDDDILGVARTAAGRTP